MLDETIQGVLGQEELSNLFTYYRNSLGEEFIQIDVMFVRKMTNKKYKTWMLKCKGIDLTEVLEASLDDLNTILSKRAIDKYDLELSADETVQIVERDTVINFPTIMANLTVDYSDENTVNDKVDYNKFEFVIIKLSDNKESTPRSSITMIKKYFKLPAKFKKARCYTFNGNEAKPFNKELLIIN